MIAGILILCLGGSLLVLLFVNNSTPNQPTALPTVPFQNNLTEAVVPTPLPDINQLLSTLQQQAPTPLAEDTPRQPVRLEISRLGIDSPVVMVGRNEEGLIITPERAVGYWNRSARLEAYSNVVLVGHNNPNPLPVLAGINDIQTGDTIRLTDQFSEEYVYTVLQVEVFEAYDNDALRYLLPTPNKRVTIISCHPDPACGQRLVVVAEP